MGLERIVTIGAAHPLCSGFLRYCISIDESAGDL